MVTTECADCECFFDERDATWIAPMFKSSEPIDSHVLELETVVSTMPGPMSPAYCPKCYEAFRQQNGPQGAGSDGSRTP
jgi:hypothetical protein